MACGEPFRSVTKQLVHCELAPGHQDHLDALEGSEQHYAKRQDGALVTWL